MSADSKKRSAAEAALAFVPDNEVLGVGTGSTVNFFIDALAARKVPIKGAVSSSESSTARLKHHGIEVLDLNAVGDFDVYVDGPRVHLLTVHAFSSTSNGSSRAFALRYQRSTDGGASWSQPVLLGREQPPPETAQRGADVQVAAAAGVHLIAVWTAKATTDRYGRGPLVTAISSDGGRTWRAGPDPADDGDPDRGRAFIDVAADHDGAFHLVWLDGRTGEGKSLVYARSTDGGATWSKNLVLDPACCECCWNSLLVLPGGRVVVLYRDKDPRDMAMLMSNDRGETWATQPVAVGAFDWQFTGCPHVGGAIAPAGGTGERLAAVVWTAKGDGVMGVFALTSGDDGRRPARASISEASAERGNSRDTAAVSACRPAAVTDSSKPTSSTVAPTSSVPSGHGTV